MSMHSLPPLLALLLVMAFTTALLRYIWGQRYQIDGAMINNQINSNDCMNVSIVYSGWPTSIPYTSERLSPKLFDSDSAIGIISYVPTLLKTLRPQLASSPLNGRRLMYGWAR